MPLWACFPTLAYKPLRRLCRPYSPYPPGQRRLTQTITRLQQEIGFYALLLSLFCASPHRGCGLMCEPPTRTLEVCRIANGVNSGYSISKFDLLGQVVNMVASHETCSPTSCGSSRNCAHLLMR